MAEQLAVKGNELPVRNPSQVQGVLMLAVGLALAALLLVFVLPAVSRTRAVIDLIIDWRQGNERYILTFIVTILFWLVAIRIAYQSAWLILTGFKRLTMFFVPPGIPQNLTEPDSIGKLLRERVIATFQQIPPGVGAAVRMISPRLRFLTYWPSRHVASMMSTIKLWLVLLPVFIAPVIVMSLIPNSVWYDLGRALNISRLEIVYPFPWLLVLVVLLVVAVQVAATLAMTVSSPKADIFEQRTHVVNTGNPNNFFNFVLEKFDRMRAGNFQNRLYDQKQPLSANIKTGDTHNFDGLLALETQPWPVVKKFNAAAIVMGLGGAVLVLVGYVTALIVLTKYMHGSEYWALMAQGSTQQSFIEQGRYLAASLPGHLLILLAYLVAVHYGRDLLKLGMQLTELYLWESDLIGLKMTGTYTASKIGYGDGRGGQLHSSRASIQSDTHLVLTGARIVTESRPVGLTGGLEGPRYIVSATTPPDFQKRVEQFLNDIRTFKDSSGKLAGIDIRDEGFQEMADANIQLTPRQHAAGKAGELMAQRSLETAGPADLLPNDPAAVKAITDMPGSAASPEDFKECPDCAEMVRVKARKCRFCGHEFEADDQPPPSGSEAS
ncbi:MAG: zinc ribbon domain-containing protein [Proteobacteria bacterium]|nr:zinc ribbon domain-containing protein [Pseudomonadota bacterium]